MKINVDLYTKNNSSIKEYKGTNEYPQRVYMLEIVDKEKQNKLVKQLIDDVKLN